MTLIPHRLLAATLTAFTFAATACSVPESSGHAASIDGTRTADHSVADAHGAGSSALDAVTGALVDGSDLGSIAQDPQDPVAVQRSRVLVEKAIEDAETMIQNGQLEAARIELLKAKSLAPNNERVLELERAVSSRLGLPAPGGTFAENLEQIYQINEQRRRSEVAAMLDEAERAAAEEDYDAALRALRRAQLNVEIGDNVNWGDLEGRVSSALQATEEARDRAERERSEEIRREIDQQKRELAAERQARTEVQRDQQLALATRAFERRSFKVAQDLALNAMRIDPTSEIARQLHDASIKALRETQTDKYYQEMAKEIRRMLEREAEIKVPQLDILRVDQDVFERASRRVSMTSTANDVDPDDEAMRQRVETTLLSGLSFTEDDGSFDEVRSRIQTITDIPIIVTAAARETIDGEGLTVTLDIVAPMTVANLLNHMTGKSEALAWTVENGVVQITTKALAGGQNRSKLHDVRDLVYPRTTFLPPLIQGIPTGDSDSERPRTGGESEEFTFFIEMDPLVQAIRDATDPTYWDSEGGGTIDQAESGYLLVVANPRMQAAVTQTLDDLRAFATTVVKVDSKFLTVTRNFLQEVGVDFRGLGGSGAKGTVATLDDVNNGLDDSASAGFDNAGTADPAANPASGAFFNEGGDGDIRGRTENFFRNPLGSALTPNGGVTAALVYLDDLQLQAVIRAVEKQEDVEELNGQTVTIQNNERGYVSVINQTSYIRDFDVEVAQAAFIADPKVDVIQDGIVLDVRPTIHHDRKNVTLDLNPTVAELIRPIPTFSTSLAGTTQPVTLQLPQLTVRSFATTATVPDGGSLLIGGLREVLTIERRAEVPIFGKIPLLSFFFKQEGIVDENSSLMVLVTASITDVKEYAERR